MLCRYLRFLGGVLSEREILPEYFYRTGQSTWWIVIRAEMTWCAVNWLCPRAQEACWYLQGRDCIDCVGWTGL